MSENVAIRNRGIITMPGGEQKNFAIYHTHNGKQFLAYEGVNAAKRESRRLQKSGVTVRVKK